MTFNYFTDFPNFIMEPASSFVYEMSRTLSKFCSPVSVLLVGLHEHVCIRVCVRACVYTCTRAYGCAFWDNIPLLSFNMNMCGLKGPLFKGFLLPSFVSLVFYASILIFIYSQFYM